MNRLFHSTLAVTIAVAFACEAIFFRHPSPLAFVALIVVYIGAWAVLMHTSCSWRSRWPFIAFIPVALLAYAFLFRMDQTAWLIYAALIAGLTLFVTAYVPLRYTKGTFLGPSSLPFVRAPLTIVDKGFVLVKKVLRIRLETSRGRQVLMGLVLAAPLLIIFGALFYSADGVFKQVVGRIDWLQNFVRIFSWSGFGTIIRFLVWFLLVGGLLSYFIEEDYAAVPVVPRQRVVPEITVLVVIGLIAALFIFFNITQLSGLLLETGLNGLTYAEYAREGFGQLVLALMLSFAMIWVICHLYGQESWPRRVRIVTGVFLAQLIPLALSAWYRLNLYQQAYGFTLPRLYAEGAIVVSFAVMALYAAVLLGKLRYERIVHISVGIVVMAIAILGIIGPSYLVARWNFERLAADKTFDASYMALLATTDPDSLRAWVAMKDPAVQDAIKRNNQSGAGTASDWVLMLTTLQEVYDDLPYYHLPDPKDGGSALWSYHPGARHVQGVVRDLLVALPPR